MLRVAPLWMLHEDGSAESTPTELQTVLNELIPRLDGLKWAGPGIVASANVDLESLEFDQVWPPFAQKERGTAEIERDLTQAKTELRVALKAAATELWAQRGVTSESQAEGDTCPRCAGQAKPGAAFCKFCGIRFPSTECHGCGAEREPDGAFCPHCGINYALESMLGVTDLRSRRRDDQVAPRPANGALVIANGNHPSPGDSFDKSLVRVQRF